jgi:hypothetical protein
MWICSQETMVEVLDLAWVNGEESEAGVELLL